MRASFVIQDMRLIHHCANKIKKYSKHLSILMIKQYFKNTTEFHFVTVDKDIEVKEIKNLDTKKAVRQDDISVKTFKLNNDTFSQYFLRFFMKVLKQLIFQTK